MEELIQHLPTDRRHPRLWFERLVIFSEPDESHVVRSVPFHRGLNLVWAKEPAAGQARGTRAAGHGVGKTSLCLLLRFCLGEASKAVAELRDELFSEFAQGGVIAVLHVGDQPVTLRRYFNPHKDGTAWPGDAAAGMWTCATQETSDRAFLKTLAGDMMRPVSPRAIPETGQAIEWKHVLAWISRDQGSRFKSFFAWREGEGTGLQRGRQDPPIVMRAVLGLLEQPESQVMARISALEQDLETARQATADLLLEPTLIRRSIESKLRNKGNLPSDLPIRASDLFGDSVAQRIAVANEKAAELVAQWESRLDEATQALADLRAELKSRKDEEARAQAQFDLSDAARRKDEAAFLSIGAKLAKLRKLTGHCDDGNVPFAQCGHIQDEMNRLQFSSLQDLREKKTLDHAMAESAGRANAALARVEAVKERIAAQERDESALVAKRIRIGNGKRTAEMDANKWPDLLEELTLWEQSAGSAEAQVAIDASVAKAIAVEQELNGARTRLALLQATRTEREKALARITDGLTRQLLPDDAFGTFNPRDENRPFHLSLRGGEAYRVLEVLLGDVACMLDSARQESALPGLFIHDCPREADMSTGLYENFLALIGALHSTRGPGQSAPFQYIVTTTTPPPTELQDQAVCVVLDPSTDEGLLFGRRFIGERQAVLE